MRRKTLCPEPSRKVKPRTSEIHSPTLTQTISRVSPGEWNAALRQLTQAKDDTLDVIEDDGQADGVEVVIYDSERPVHGSNNIVARTSKDDLRNILSDVRSLHSDTDRSELQRRSVVISKRQIYFLSRKK